MSKLTEDSFYNLQNIYEVIVVIGYGDYELIEVEKAINSLFQEESLEFKKDLKSRVLKQIDLIN